MSNPILFIIFNRPDLTEKTFEVLRRQKPARLFVAADGPRAVVPSDKEACRAARKIIERGSELTPTDRPEIFNRTLTHRIYGKVAARLHRFNYMQWREEQIIKWLRATEVKAVLAEYGPTGLRMMNWCELAGIPLVVHFHGYDASCHDVLEQHTADYKIMFQSAAAIIGVSKAMCDQLLTLGVPSEKIHYVPYMVDLNKFAALDTREFNSNLLAVGRFVEKKASHLTLLVFAQALKQRPELKLEMVGVGTLLGPCKWLAKSLNIEDSVVFHGAKEHNWVAKRMRDVGAFIQHSVIAKDGDSEGTPVAILEAQASGLPVISTRHAGINDVVIHEETGYLSDEGDVDAMASRILRIAEMPPNEYDQMCLASRARIETHFSKANTIEKLASIISKCIQDAS